MTSLTVVHDKTVILEFNLINSGELQSRPSIPYGILHNQGQYHHIVEPVLKDRPIGPYSCGLSREVVFCGRFDYIEMSELLTGIFGLSRQVVSYCSDL